MRHHVLLAAAALAASLPVAASADPVPRSWRPCSTLWETGNLGPSGQFNGVTHGGPSSSPRTACR